MSSLLQKAIDLAVEAHRGAEDPPDEPYIIHPLRVLMRVSQSDDSSQNNELRVVAVLHDVLERGDMTEKKLRAAGIPKHLVRAIQLLTHDKNVSYAEYVIRLKPNPLARAVKIADLLDNADLRRVTFRGDKAKKDSRRVIRYAASYKFLTDQMTKTEYRKAMGQGE